MKYSANKQASSKTVVNISTRPNVEVVKHETQMKEEEKLGVEWFICMLLCEKIFGVLPAFCCGLRQTYKSSPKVAFGPLYTASLNFDSSLPKHTRL